MDIAIIGAGPVGLFAAFQAGLLGLKACIIDTQEFVGGQCSALYPEKPIYDIPAHPSILGAELTKNLEMQARHFSTKFYLGEQVQNISQDKATKIFTLQTSTGKIIQAKSILIAAGLGTFRPNKPMLDSIIHYENQSIFYTVGDKNHFKGKHVCIFGGGDSAADWTIELVDIARSITLIHRREEFRCSPSSVVLLEDLHDNNKIHIRRSCQLLELEGNEHIGALKALTLIDKNQNRFRLEIDAALFFLGSSISLGPIANWNLELERKSIKVDPSKMSASIPGIFGAGDIITYPGKLKSITVGFGEAVTACYAIKNYLDPNSSQTFIHSTSQSELFSIKTPAP